MARKPKTKVRKPKTKGKGKSKTADNVSDESPRPGFLKRFGEAFLDEMGLKGGDFKAGGFVKGKLGLFAGAMSKGRATDSGGIPPLQSPKTESNKSNPNLSTLIDQLESLVKTAKKLGVITNDQQKDLLKDINESRKVDKEAFIENNESGGSSLGAGAGVSAEMLAPLSTSIQELAKKLKLFGETLDEKLEEKEEKEEDGGTFGSRFLDAFADQFGLKEEYQDYKNKRDTPENQKKRRMAQRERRASRFKPDQLLDKNGRRLSGAALDSKLNVLERTGGGGGRLSRFLSGAKNAAGSAKNIALGLGGAAAYGGRSIMGRMPFGGGAAAGGRGAIRGGGAVREAVKKIAGPLISKTVGKTALKSIPILGAAAGLGFALDRLLKGDVVGAGLEAASGLAGPLTAIPAMVASIARDAYFGVFGVQPEQDPESPKRIVEVKNATEALVKEAMGGQVEKKEKPNPDEIDKQLIGDEAKAPAPPPPPKQEKKEPPIPPPPTPKVADKTADKGGGDGGGPPPAPKPESSGDGGAGAPGAPADSGQDSSKTVQAQDLSGSELKGGDLNASTVEVARMEDQDETIVLPGPDNSLIPSNIGPTTKPGASGMGDVRSPYYDPAAMGSIPSQVYF